MTTVIFRQLTVLLLAVLAVWWPSAQVFAQGFKVTPEIKELIDKGNFREAERIASQQNPVNPILIGWLKAKSGTTDEAIKYLEQTHSLDVKSESAPQDILKITAVVSDVSNSEAIRLLESYLENESLDSNSDLWLRLLSLYGDSPDPSAGEYVARRVLELNPPSEKLLTPLYEYAVALYTHRKSEKALQYYLKLRERVPVAQIDPGYQLQFSHILTAGGRPLDALTLIDGIRSDFPDYAEQHRSLLLAASGLAYEALGDYESATEEFKALIEAGYDSQQNRAFMQLAKDKLRNYAEDKAFRELTGDSDEAATSISSIQDSSDEKRVGLIVVLVINALLVVGIALYFLRKRMGGASK